MINQWCTIQSDPGVFTEMIKLFGIQQLQVQQLYSIQDNFTIQRISPIHGFIFLFKWPKAYQVYFFYQHRQCLTNYDKDLFFAKQIIQNACATQAILSIIMNIPNIDLGPTLSSFKQFTKDMNAQSKGLTLGNCSQIMRVNNSFAQQKIKVFNKISFTILCHIFHLRIKFMNQMDYNKDLFCQKNLRKLMNGQGLLKSKQVKESKSKKCIKRYSQKQIRFNLLAVCKSIQNQMITNIRKANIQKLKIYNTLQQNKVLPQQYLQEYQHLVYIYQQKKIFPDIQLPLLQTIDQNQLLHLNQQIVQYQSRIQQQKEKKRSYKVQNCRRRHNYIPFIVNLLKGLAQKNKLELLIQKAKNKK